MYFKRKNHSHKSSLPRWPAFQRKVHHYKKKYFFKWFAKQWCITARGKGITCCWYSCSQLSGTTEKMLSLRYRYWLITWRHNLLVSSYICSSQLLSISVWLMGLTEWIYSKMKDQNVIPLVSNISTWLCQNEKSVLLTLYSFPFPGTAVSWGGRSVGAARQISKAKHEPAVWCAG